MMSEHEVDEAVKELRAAWYAPLSEVAERIWRRTLPGITKDEFKLTLDTFVKRGIGRPPPSEFYELARSSAGVKPGRQQRPGPFLEDVQPPTEDFSDRVAELRERVGK